MSLEAVWHSYSAGDGKGCLFRTAFEQICEPKTIKKTAKEEV